MLLVGNTTKPMVVATRRHPKGRSCRVTDRARSSLPERIEQAGMVEAGEVVGLGEEGLAVGGCAIDDDQSTPIYSYFKSKPIPE